MLAGVLLAVATAADVFTKHLLTEYVSEGARCLDGSPGGYYIREGDPSKWAIWNEGGGWCMSPENCLARAGTALGSSTFWGPGVPVAYESWALFDQPEFANFTVAFVRYCDGGSMAGNATQVVNGTTLYYAGAALRVAVMRDLIARHGLLNNSLPADTQTTLLYGGFSAGALTGYLHVDWAGDLLTKLAPTYGKTGGVVVRGFMDAMYSVPSDNVQHQPRFPTQMAWVVSGMNIRAETMNAACAAAHPTALWQCMFGTVVLPYVQAPTFVLNSKYDTWQQVAIIGATDCTTSPPLQCSPYEQGFWTNYTHLLIAAADAAPSRHSIFLTNCATHVLSSHVERYSDLRVGGVTLGAAVAAWWAGAEGQRWIARCDLKPCPGDYCW